MPGLDASSIIYGWDNYPPGQFPPLWRWIGSQVDTGAFVMSKVAYEEVKQHAPDCAKWLDDEGLQQVTVSADIAQEAVRIKGILEIDGDRYHPKGVGENDLIIIATACVEGHELVSNEGRQNNPPSVKAKMKIPAVCELQEVDVPCLNFVELIKRSGQVFGA